jgi:hypothetical protein
MDGCGLDFRTRYANTHFGLILISFIVIFGPLCGPAFEGAPTKVCNVCRLTLLMNSFILFIRGSFNNALSAADCVGQMCGSRGDGDE